MPDPSPLDEVTAEKLLAAMMEGKPRRSPFPSLTLVGTPRFRPFRNVWMLEELRDALPDDVGFRYEHTMAAPQSDEARAHHPMGKVPSLLVRDGTEGDFTLIESAAINSWLGDRMREYAGDDSSGFLVPRPGSRDRAVYDSFVQFLVAEADSSGLWIHRKLESLGEKRYHRFFPYSSAFHAVLWKCTGAPEPPEQRGAPPRELGGLLREGLGTVPRSLAGRFSVHAVPLSF